MGRGHFGVTGAVQCPPNGVQFWKPHAERCQEHDPVDGLDAWPPFVVMIAQCRK